MKKRPAQKPILHLTGTGKGAPSFEDLMKLFAALTGREPTPEEIEQARQTLEDTTPSHRIDE